MSCGVGHRRSLDLVLLWLWYRRAAAALIHPLAWEFLHVMGAALKKKMLLLKKRKIKINEGESSKEHFYKNTVVANSNT